MKTSVKLLAAGLMAVAGTTLGSHGVDSDPKPHLHDDVVLDGQADVLFTAGTALAYWALGSPMGGAVVGSSRYVGNAGPGYRVAAVSDFNGDRAADVMWSNGSHLKLWVNDGAGRFESVAVAHYGGGWQPFAAGDINADGKSDLFFRNSTHVAYWLMDGAGVVESRYAGNGGPGYRVVAIADFTGKQRGTPRSVDILWSNGSQLKVSVSNPYTGTFQTHELGAYSGGWEPFAGGDVNYDATADILFRRGTQLAYWVIIGVSPFQYVSRYAGDAGPGYRAIAVSDYGNDGYDDGLADVLWSNGSQLRLWLGSCTWDWFAGCTSQRFLAHPLAAYGGGWQPVIMVVRPD